MSKYDFLRKIFTKFINPPVESQDNLLIRSLDDAHQSKVLPPFGGEMGFEIRSFLGRVEPWLRNGWKILARRPEYYPPNTTISDPEYFKRESEILQKYHGFRVGFSYYIPPKNFFSQPPKGKIIDKVKDVIDNLESINSGLKFEREMRELFRQYLFPVERPLTVWDKVLLSTTRPSDPESCILYYNDTILPTYQPIDFVEPKATWEPHIGVQLRYLKWNDHRNSDPERVLSLASKASQHLQLPILIYGHPVGTILPDGYAHTVDRGLEGLLKRELGYLKQCQLMFAPDSGWGDLMAWLKIPTLLEKESAIGVFYWLKHWQPKLDVIDDEIDIIVQIDRLLSVSECAPDPLLKKQIQGNLEKDGNDLLKLNFLQFG